MPWELHTLVLHYAVFLGIWTQFFRFAQWMLCPLLLPFPRGGQRPRVRHVCLRLDLTLQPRLIWTYYSLWLSNMWYVMPTFSFCVIVFYFLELQIFSVFKLSVCLCELMCTWLEVPRDQRRALDPLELELQAVSCKLSSLSVSNQTRSFSRPVCMLKDFLTISETGLLGNSHRLQNHYTPTSPPNAAISDIPCLTSVDSR